MTWTTLTVQVTTPLFNGGADPGNAAGLRSGAEAGVRVASIRGAMRFWFRALAGVLTGPRVALLAALEQRVFGGASDGRGRDGGPASSCLILRLPDPPLPSREMNPPFLRDRNGRWIAYLLGLGLMKPDKDGPQLLRQFVSPGESFHLMVRFRHDRRATAEIQQAIEALAFASLWLACAYGGLGARVRRGFGGMRITEAEGDVPYPWSPKWLLTPGAELHRNAERLWPWPDGVFGVFQQYLRVLIEAEGADAGVPDDWAAPPDYPVLSRKYSRAVLVPRRMESWEEVLAYGGRQLRLFRANRPVDEELRRQARVRTAEWDDVINGDSADFPLGALGLPVGYHDKVTKRKFIVNAMNQKGSGLEELRRASPLWLRPIRSADSWYLLTFAFRARFLPGGDTDRVYLLPDEQARAAGWHQDEVFVDDDDLTRLTSQWMTIMRGGGDFTYTLRS